MAAFDESPVVIDKLSAARHLLDQAVVQLQAADYLSAIILGGTAEDLLEGSSASADRSRLRLARS